MNYPGEMETKSIITSNPVEFRTEYLPNEITELRIYLYTKQSGWAFLKWRIVELSDSKALWRVYLPRKEPLVRVRHYHMPQKMDNTTELILREQKQRKKQKMKNNERQKETTPFVVGPVLNVMRNSYR